MRRIRLSEPRTSRITADSPTAAFHLAAGDWKPQVPEVADLSPSGSNRSPWSSHERDSGSSSPPPGAKRDDVPPADRRSWLKQRWNLIGQWQGTQLPYPGRKVKHVDEVLDQVLRDANLDERLCAESVVAEWRELVGAFIAQHSQPDNLRRGTLIVRVAQPTVRFALEGQKAKILQRLQQRFGPAKIRAIKFMIG